MYGGGRREVRGWGRDDSPPSISLAGAGTRTFAAAPAATAREPDRLAKQQGSFNKGGKTLFVCTRCMHNKFVCRACMGEQWGACSKVRAARCVQ